MMRVGGKTDKCNKSNRHTQEIQKQKKSNIGELHSNTNIYIIQLTDIYILICVYTNTYTSAKAHLRTREGSHIYSYTCTQTH